LLTRTVGDPQSCVIIHLWVDYPAAKAAYMSSTFSSITSRHASVSGVNLCYLEAAPKDAPIVVPLHGYPSSSRMYAPLMELLADRYHLIAPDYPGFGQSEAPPPSRHRYTFDHLAETMGALLEQLNVDRYVLFMQDYGGPVGMRVALAHPQRVQALMVPGVAATQLTLVQPNLDSASSQARADPLSRDRISRGVTQKYRPGLHRSLPSYFIGLII
jgi:pimeloyl-ACP methyl ester carboxylesterase